MEKQEKYEKVNKMIDLHFTKVHTKPINLIVLLALLIEGRGTTIRLY